MTESEKRTVMAVFGELLEKPYKELNTFLGSETIREMQMIYRRLRWELSYDEDLVALRYKLVDGGVHVVVGTHNDVYLDNVYFAGEEYDNGVLTFDDFLTNIIIYFEADICLEEAK